MIIKRNNEGSVFETAWYTLSKEEQEELKNICNRLMEMFLAESVGLHVENMSIRGTSDVVIDIRGCKQGMQIK